MAQSCYEQVSFYGLSPERLPYRLVSENSRGLWTNPYSSSTRTERDFTSAAGEPGVPALLPLIQLDHRVDTDTTGKARRNTRLVVTPSHLPGGPSSDAIKALTLDVSYDDGATWQKATRTHRGAGWEATLHGPADAAYATLRASAHDDQGDSVTQSITRAFGLKQPLSLCHPGGAAHRGPARVTGVVRGQGRTALRCGPLDAAPLRAQLRARGSRLVPVVVAGPAQAGRVGDACPGAALRGAVGLSWPR